MARSTRNTIRLELFWRERKASRGGQLKRRLRNGGDVGEAPVFHVRGRKAHLAKARKGALAEIAQPCELVSNRRPLKAAEALEVISQLLWCRRDHDSFPQVQAAGAALRASASIEPYPFSSSSRARSAPPE